MFTINNLNLLPQSTRTQLKLRDLICPLLINKNNKSFCHQNTFFSFVMSVVPVVSNKDSTAGRADTFNQAAFNDLIMSIFIGPDPMECAWGDKLISPIYLLFFSGCIFFIGLCGFLFNRSHIVLMLIAAEILLLSAFLNFAYCSYLFDDPKGQIYALIILVIAACEAAIGLSLIINLFRIKKDLSLASANILKG